MSLTLSMVVLVGFRQRLNKHTVSIQTTLDRYGHLMPDAHAAEARKLDRLVFGENGHRAIDGAADGAGCPLRTGAYLLPVPGGAGHGNVARPHREAADSRGHHATGAVRRASGRCLPAGAAARRAAPGAWSLAGGPATA